jgi:hemerythrin
MEPRNRGLHTSWKDRFAVGHPLIDAQHRAFFDSIDDVMDALEGDASRDAVLTFYGSFLEDLALHFRDEEALLYAVGYPQADKHAQEHSALMNSVTAVETMLLTGDNAADLRFIIRALMSSLVEHLVSEDLRYKEWVRVRA